MMMFRSALRCVVCAAAGALMLSAAGSQAQTPTRRLATIPAGGETRAMLPGSVTGHPRASAALGPLAGDTALVSMSLILKLTQAQDAALTQLLSDQQNPASAIYHQWLTPQQFGERFGVAEADLVLLRSWLQSRGFAVQSVPASHNQITFSGTASAVENAFRVNMQRYRRNGREFYENSTAVQLPESLTAIVGGVTGLSSYRLPAPQSKRLALSQSTGLATASPDYTTSTSTHYIVPWDLRQIYGTNTLIGSGYDGTGVKIGIVGQSALDTAQITYFQQKTGQTVSLPTMVLVPGTGASNRVSGDEAESELDVEYASGNAPGAAVQFIYTGCTSTASASILSGTTNCSNNGVFDALTYAVTSNLAPILSLSYGGCEAEDASYATSTLEPVLRQANAQGQTIMVSSGDAGAASCETSGSAKTASAGLAVSYPASSPYVTAVGGTQLATDSPTYWSSSNNTYLGSAIGYMPEVAWNDTVAYGSLTSSGGGYSKIFGKPSWQAGAGVPADGHRDVPDISFPANVSEHAYLTCDADGPCTIGTKSFTPTGSPKDGGGVGGTSASAPSFAGMMAIVEQANGGKALGNINPDLYSLAASTSGSTIFHDITTGSNVVPCLAGTADCTGGSLGYTATAGYDLVTGLGSVAIPALMTGLQTAAATSRNTPTVSLTATSTTPLIGTALTFSAAVTGISGTPTGTVTFSIDGAASGRAVPLTAGAATYTLASGFSAAGSHTVVATYSGDGTYLIASGTLALTAAAAGASISVATSAAALSVTYGSTVSTSVIVTSTNGASGATSFKLALVSYTGANFTGCYSLSPSSLTLPGSQSATTTLTLYTTVSSCNTSGRVSLEGAVAQADPGPGMNRSRQSAWAIVPACLFTWLAFRRRLRPALLLVILLASLGAFGMVGCGSGTSSVGTATTGTGTTGTGTTGTGTSSTTNSTSSGTYSIRINASTVTSTGTVGAASNLTLTVQ